MRWRTLRTTPTIAAVTVAVALIVGAAGPTAAYPRPGATERVDIPSAGGRQGGTPWEAGISLSKDGRFIAFTTHAPLVRLDVNENEDVYVRDLEKGTTELITKSPQGLPAVGPRATIPHPPVISANGRYVAFASAATNLVANDTNLVEDVFVHDRKRGTTEIVSVDERGRPPQPDGVCGPFTGGTCSWAPSVDSAGRRISFTSWAALVENDTNMGPDVYVYDRRSDRAVRASVDSDGNQVTTCRVDANLHSVEGMLAGGRGCEPLAGWYSSISGDGRFVAFESYAAGLVERDLNQTWDVFVRDLERERTERISVASDGAEAIDPQGSGTLYGNGSGLRERPGTSISADGRFVVFTSLAGNLVPNDANRYSIGGNDVFVHDRKTGRTERVSVTSAGREMNRPQSLAAGASSGSTSGNGRFVMFHCGCTEVPEEEGVEATWGPFVYDRKSGALHFVPGAYSHLNTRDANLSLSGRFAVFSKDEEPDPITAGRSYWRSDLGEDLGAVGSGTDGADDTSICIHGTCASAATVLSLRSTPGVRSGVGVPAAANLIGGEVGYRPSLADLHVTLELESMPRTPALAAATAGTLYGLSFDVDGRSYEVRSRSTGVGALGETTAEFALFACDRGNASCHEVAQLRGGFGTTGERITFSVPLSTLDKERRVRVSDVSAYTALGGDLLGPARVVDELRGTRART